MQKHQEKNTPPASLIFWIVWGAVLSGIFVFLFFILGGWPEGEDTEALSPMLFYGALLPAAISTLLRWLILPSKETSDAALPVFIIGLALAEGTAMIALFVVGSEYPASLRVLWSVAVITTLQYIPLFASRLKLTSSQDS